MTWEIDVLGSGLHFGIIYMVWENSVHLSATSYVISLDYINDKLYSLDSSPSSHFSKAVRMSQHL